MLRAAGSSVREMIPLWLRGPTPPHTCHNRHCRYFEPGAGSHPWLFLLRLLLHRTSLAGKSLQATGPGMYRDDWSMQSFCRHLDSSIFPTTSSHPCVFKKQGIENVRLKWTISWKRGHLECRILYQDSPSLQVFQHRCKKFGFTEGSSSGQPFFGPDGQFEVPGRSYPMKPLIPSAMNWMERAASKTPSNRFIILFPVFPSTCATAREASRQRSAELKTTSRAAKR